MATAVSPPGDSPTPSLARRRRSALRPLRFWYLEIASLAAATAVVTTIIAILVNFDGRALPNWPHAVNLNTLIALLTLCLRTALAVVTAEIVGQCKWIWFSGGGRPLTNFQTFDEASRGALGSLKLVALLRLGLRGSPLAVAACVTAVASLAVGPFTQQAIRTAPCTHAARRGGASFPVALYVPGLDGLSDSELGLGAFRPGSSTRDALIASLLLPNVNDSAIRPACSTGNCSFPNPYGVPHSTIGLCSQCIDTTSLLTHSSYNEIGGHETATAYNASLGNLTIGTPKQFPKFVMGTSNLSFAESILSPEFKYASNQACANVSILTFSHHPRGNNRSVSSRAYGSEHAMAVSCTLYPCMKDIQVDVINGQVEERVINTVPARAEEAAVNESARPYMPLHVVKSPCLVDGSLYDSNNFSMAPVDARKRTFTSVTTAAHGRLSVPSDCLYTMSGPYRAALASFMSLLLFAGQCTSEVLSEAPGYANTDCRRSWWLRKVYNGGFASYETLSRTIQQVATSMTNFFRLDGFGTIHNDTVAPQHHVPPNKGSVPGDVMETTVCVHLDWRWLLLPVALCLVTTALLLTMIYISAMKRQQPVWKSNTFPLLFLGLDARPADGPPRHSPSDETLRHFEQHGLAAERRRRHGEPPAAGQRQGRDKRPSCGSRRHEPPAQTDSADLEGMERRARFTTATLDLATAVLRPVPRRRAEDG